MNSIVKLANHNKVGSLIQLSHVNTLNDWCSLTALVSFIEKMIEYFDFTFQSKSSEYKCQYELLYPLHA